MANFNPSILVNAQTKIDKKFADPEMRMKPAPAFQLLESNTPFVIGNVEELRTREDRAIEAKMFSRTKRATTSARTYNHTGSFGDTSTRTLTWGTYTDVFSISLKLLDNNVFSFEQAFQNSLENACMNVLEDVETASIAYLLAQRATQQPTLKNATFNATNDAVEITANNTNTFFQRVRSVMKQNYFGGRLDIITDPAAQVLFDYQAAQGTANATNLQFQFTNGGQFAESVELNDANYANGIILAMPAGTACAYSWVPQQNRRGYGDYNSYNGGYGTINFMGYQFALHGYALRADTSASNGNTQDLLMQFEVSVDVSFNKAPLVTTTDRADSVIIEFAQAS